MSLSSVNAAAPGQPFVVSSEGATAIIEHPLILNGTSFLAMNAGTIPVHIRSTYADEEGVGEGVGGPGTNYPLVPANGSVIVRKRVGDTHLAMVTAEGYDGSSKVLIYPVVN